MLGSLLDLVQTLFWFTIIISIVVFFHELGHFYFARKFGVKVEVFSIGFGRELVGWNDSRGTRWKISMIPMGGYIKMFGDVGPASMPDSEKLSGFSEKEKKRSFHYKPLWQKAIIVAAGPVANYLLAILLLASIFFFYGKVIRSTEIGEVVENSPAAEAGIIAGDIVKKVDGKKVNDFNDLRQIILMHGSERPFTLVIARQSKEYNVTVTPKMMELADSRGNKMKVAFLGIIASADAQHRRLGIGASLYEGAYQSYNISIHMLNALWKMVTGQISTDDIGGPVKIATYSKQSAENGLLGVISYISMLSLNLGLVNILPIPVLDGGHILYYAIEAVIRRPIPERLKSYGFKLGVFLIMALMALAVSNDIKFLFLG